MTGNTVSYTVKAYVCGRIVPLEFFILDSPRGSVIQFLTERGSPVGESKILISKGKDRDGKE